MLDINIYVKSCYAKVYETIKIPKFTYIKSHLLILMRNKILKTSFLIFLCYKTYLGKKIF